MRWSPILCLCRASLLSNSSALIRYASGRCLPLPVPLPLRSPFILAVSSPTSLDLCSVLGGVAKLGQHFFEEIETFNFFEIVASNDREIKKIPEGGISNAEFPEALSKSVLESVKEVRACCRKVMCRIPVFTMRPATRPMTSIGSSKNVDVSGQKVQARII